MGKIRSILHYLTLGVIDDNKEYKRKHSTFSFDSDITLKDFETLAINASKGIKRLSVKVENQFVTGNVRTISGLNNWSFKIDFNDFGKITGRCWICYSDNSKSDIPEIYAEKLSSEIVLFLKNKKNELNNKAQYEEQTYNDENIDDIDNEQDIRTEIYCPYCNSILNEQKNFSEEKDFIICENCDHKVFNSEIFSGILYPGVYWFCDGCNALLNKQRGFNDENGIWFCSECGYKNKISEKNITE